MFFLYIREQIKHIWRPHLGCKWTASYLYDNQIGLCWLNSGFCSPLCSSRTQAKQQRPISKGPSGAAALDLHFKIRQTLVFGCLTQISGHLPPASGEEGEGEREEAPWLPQFAWSRENSATHWSWNISWSERGEKAVTGKQ